MIENLDSAQHSIQRYLLAGIILAALLTFGIGGWAATTELSSAVIAQGALVVDFSVKKVQHPSGGVVSELRVRNGDRVRAGDILLRLDETQTRAAATIITKSVDELLARQARLETERDNAREIAFPAALLDRRAKRTPMQPEPLPRNAAFLTSVDRRAMGKSLNSRNAARSCRRRLRDILDSSKPRKGKSSSSRRNSTAYELSGRSVSYRSAG